jgi:hypothetical protein
LSGLLVGKALALPTDVEESVMVLEVQVVHYRNICTAVLENFQHFPRILDTSKLSGKDRYAAGPLFFF